MLFSIPTANIASISGVTLLGISSSLAFETSGSIRAAVKTIGSECTFIDTFQVNHTPDTGILNCEIGEVCIEDETSSIGGRCVPYEEDESAHRHLEGIACQYSDGTSGVKCQGVEACENVDPEYVGCGSCIGELSCYNPIGSPYFSVVGERSCRGRRACYDSHVTIGYNSCNAENACQFNVYTNIGGCLCNSVRECVNLQPGIDKNYNNCPTGAPTSTAPTTAAPTQSPSAAPSSAPSSSPTTCATIARKVKIESTTKEQIQLFDVKVFSTSGVDETKGFAAVASQSSTFKNNERFAASNAIDSDFGSFSHTNDSNAWWQVDMGKNVEVRSLEIINRWCGGTISVPNTCLCRLSGAKVSLLDGNGSVISTQTLGDTCSEPSLKLDFDYNCNSCLPNANKLKLQSNTGTPLSLLEVEVYSNGVNVAANKIATSSSTFRDLDKLAAGVAVDEDYASFSATNGGTDVSPWWEVNLGDSFDITNLKIFNRLNKNIPTGGLCNLSQVTILLLDANGKWVDAVLTGDTCGLLLWRHEYESSPQYCLRR